MSRCLLALLSLLWSWGLHHCVCQGAQLAPCCEALAVSCTDYHSALNWQTNWTEEEAQAVRFGESSSPPSRRLRVGSPTGHSIHPRQHDLAMWNMQHIQCTQLHALSPMPGALDACMERQEIQEQEQERKASEERERQGQADPASSIGFSAELDACSAHIRQPTVGGFHPTRSPECPESRNGHDQWSTTATTGATSTRCNLARSHCHRTSRRH